jgi:hypothetical protein
MKILALGDPHGKLPKNLDSIINKNKIDVLVCIGDVPPVPKAFRKGKISYFPKEFLKKADKLYKEIIKKLCSYEKPVIILRGNMYLTGSRNKLTKKIFSSHKNLYYKKTGKLKINGKNFLLFDMSFEPHMYKKADSWMKRQFSSNKPREIMINKALKKLEDVIIISHAPPYRCLDKTEKGHRGSKILLRAIKRYKPKLVLCGHIHEAKGKSKIGKTEICNLGCCGDYKIFEI